MSRAHRQADRASHAPHEAPLRGLRHSVTIPCAEMYHWACLLCYAVGALAERDRQTGNGTYADVIERMKAASDAIVDHMGIGLLPQFSPTNEAKTAQRKSPS